MDNPFVEYAELQLLQGSHAGALQAARMGLTLFPDHPVLLEIAATCATVLGDDAYAVSLWPRLFEIKTDELAPHNSLALGLERLDRDDEAAVVYRQALARWPEAALLHSNFGLLLAKQGRLDEAEAEQRAALALSPDSAEILCNLGSLMLRRLHHEEAESLFRAALRVQPDFAIGHANLGVLLTELGRMEAAEACFRRALELRPDSQQSLTNLGELLLMQGRLAEGWVLYESRQFVYTGGQGQGVRLPSCPQWQGEPLAGKAIMVLPEQGLGDVIQFVRYLSWLKAQGAARITLVCRPSQHALLATLEGPDVLVSLSEVESLMAEHDYWVFLLSLPRHAGTTLETIPARIPYLAADPERQARFAPALAGEGLRVGLVWQGNPRHLNDAERSLPGLEVLASLWSLPGLRFFSLQKSELDLPRPAGQPLVDLAPLIGDFADTAAILSQLDLLVTVDTSVAHLAGALGVPCWVLLPRYRTDWRWLLQRCDSPWYPTLRLFRQTQRNDWQGPVSAVRAALQDLLKARSGL